MEQPEILSLRKSGSPGKINIEILFLLPRQYQCEISVWSNNSILWRRNFEKLSVNIQSEYFSVLQILTGSFSSFD